MPYRIEGTVTEEGSGRPLAGLVVRAYDEDLIRHDFLGEARTDAEGRFEVRFTEVQFQDVHETRPDVFLRVYDASGANLLHSTQRRVRRDAQLVERFELSIRAGEPTGA